MNFAEKLVALPVARQLDRLNDNLESIMQHFAIPLPAERQSRASGTTETFDFDEEQAAVDEFEAETRPGRTPADDASGSDR